MSLHPTPTRRRLLAAIDRGSVHRYGDGRDYAMDGRNLTARMAEMERAGWVALGEPHPVKTPWLLTEQGKEAMG